MAELVDRPDSTQDTTLMGIFHEPHEMKRSTPANGKLSERERGIPGSGVGEHDPECHPECSADPCHETVCQSGYETLPGPRSGANRRPEPGNRPHHYPGQEPGQEPG